MPAWLLLVSGQADGGVDADDFAIQVKQRPAGIAADQRAIGGQEIARALGNHPAEAHRWRAPGIEAGRVAERDHPIPGFQRFGRPHADKRPFAGLADFHHRDVLRVIRADDLALDLFAIGEHH